MKTIRSKWTLYAGVILWVAGMVLGLFYGDRGERMEDQLFLSMSVSLRWIWSFLVFVIFVPCYAEGVFRSWSSENKYLPWFSVLCMLLAAVRVCIGARGVFGIVAAAVALGAAVMMFYLMFRKQRGNSDKSILFVAGSTFIWISDYVSHIECLYPSAVFDIAKLTGLALICCYLAINHGLLYAIIAHACNNLVVALPLMLAHSSFNKVEMDRDDMHITLQRIYTSEQVNKIEDGGLLIEGSIEDIISTIAQKLDYGKTLYVPCDEDGLLLYRLEVESKVDLQLSPVLSAMEHEGIIKMDTSYEPLWMLDLVKSRQKGDTANGDRCWTSVNDFVSALRQMYHVPVILNPELNPELVVACPNADFKSFDDIVHQVNETGDMVISKLPYEKACVVRIHYD